MATIGMQWLIREPISSEEIQIEGYPVQLIFVAVRSTIPDPLCDCIEMGWRVKINDASYGKAYRIDKVTEESRDLLIENAAESIKAIKDNN